MTADSTSFVILRYLFDNLVTTLQKNTYKEPGRKQPFLIKAKQKEVYLGLSWRENEVSIYGEKTHGLCQVPLLSNFISPLPP